MISRILLVLALAWKVHAYDVETLWDFDHPKVSEQKILAEMNSVEARADPSIRGELMTQVARAQGMQGQFKLAWHTLDAVRVNLPDLSPSVSIRYMLERGRLIHGMGDHVHAWRWYHAAMLMAQKDRLDFFAIDSMHMLALADTGKDALDWNLEALALAEHTNDARAGIWRGALYNNIGWMYHSLHDDQRALDYLRRAQAWHEEHGADKGLLVARWNVAKMLRLSGQFDQALAILRGLKKAWADRGHEDGFVDEEMAEDMNALGMQDDAKRYYGMAYRALSHDSELAQRNPTLIEQLKQLAQ